MEVTQATPRSSHGHSSKIIEVQQVENPMVTGGMSGGGGEKMGGKIARQANIHQNERRDEGRGNLFISVADGCRSLGARARAFPARGLLIARAVVKKGPPQLGQTAIGIRAKVAYVGFER